MAMSATISLSTASTVINQVVGASITISNSGGSPVNVLYCQPKAKQTGSVSYDVNSGVAVSQPNVLQGQPFVVPASGTLVLPASFVFFAPSVIGLKPGTTTTYDCFATIQTSDGSVFNASPAATVTILPLPQPVQEQ